MSNWVAADLLPFTAPSKNWPAAPVLRCRLRMRGQFIVNPSYPAHTAAPVRPPEERPEFGLIRGRPMYLEFLEAPEKFAFLTAPEQYFNRNKQSTLGRRAL